MAVIIDEQKMLTDNMFEFEERVKSPVVRWSDKTYTPTEYYHIKNNETTADPGWNDVEEIIGDRSPVRFQVIHGLPIYGLESMVINLSETDIGLDGSYEGEGTILPGTVTPLENDFFVIKVLKDDYIFRITEVAYDTIMPDNFYKISFILEYIDAGKKEALDKQVRKKSTFIQDNIGTEERCIIEDDYYEDIRAINTMYEEMVENYITFFYNKKYNCILGDWKEGKKIFDPMQREFLHKHQLLRVKKQLDNIVLNELFTDARRKIKYEASIYRCIETKNLKKLSRFLFYTFKGMNNRQTPFARWNDNNVVILDIQAIMDPEGPTLLSENAEQVIRMNYPTDSKYLKLIANYMHRDLELTEIDLTLGEELLVLQEANTEIFFFTPIILYIIRDTINTFMATGEEKVTY